MGNNFAEHKNCNFTDRIKYLPNPEFAPFVKENLYSSKQKLNDVEMNTSGQSERSLLFKERSLCLTASNFGLVMNRRESIYPKSILSK